MKAPTTLAEFAARCSSAGVKKGESATDFRRRNPEAATKLAEFLARNRDKMAKELSKLV